ncbi:Anthocyanidin 3-O-glucosyltransferase [Bienertia sinuspersici]
MGASSKEATNLHIVMFPWFAYGHIIPFRHLSIIHLSNKLFSHNIQISFLSILRNLSRIKSALNLNPPNQLIPLTIPPIEGLFPNFDNSSDVTPQSAELLKVALDQMQPQVKTLLSQLKPQINPPQGYPKTSISSMKTFQAQNFQYLFKRFNSGISVFERIMVFTKSCDAIIYKTCSEIEGPYPDFLKK